MKTATTIEEVISKLDKIIEVSKEQKSTIGYFASTYRSTTQAVLNHIKKNKFEDNNRMTILDVAFANRYFEALESYQANKKCTNAWYTTFEAAKNKNLLIIQHILLGMNAHINLDLGIAAASIMPYRKINPLKNDFGKINDVIASINQKVQDSLSKICYPIALVDQISAGNDNVILDFAISKARETSWATAYVLSNSIALLRSPLINMVDNATTLVGRNIMATKSISPKLLKQLKDCESSDVTKNIEILSSTII